MKQVPVLALLLWVCGATAAATDVQTPAAIYGELFERVQLERVYPDSKSFVDALPVSAPEQVLAEFRQARGRPDFDLRKFVAAHFAPPPSAGAEYHTVPGQDVREHIDALWKVLERKPEDQRPYSSRLALPHRYVVPGGRFNEIYYWDSYFTMLGLEESGRHDLTTSMLDNFAWLIDQFGHVPNGNRSYYLSRSQPPFFAAMVVLAAQRDGDAAYRKYLPQLRREYEFWMEGERSLAPGAAHRRLVRLRDGTLLNRYWDDRDTAREEAYREDVATARDSGRPAAEVYRNLRAAAESGWDFGSRWLADGKTLASIHTTDFLPPDLNSLLYKLELVIASDSSSDATVAISKEYEDQGVRVFDFSARTGKAGVLDRVIPKLAGSIAVLSDANTVMDPAAIKRLVRWFRDVRVGVVCGKLILTDPSTGRNVDSLYW